MIDFYSKFSIHRGQCVRAFKTIGFLFSLLLLTPPLFAQSVSGIVTDFGGYWKSSAAHMNNTKPDNSHNLLAFTFNGVQYSTGANDGLLTAHGETFTAGDYWSLPIENISSVKNSNTKVGFGAMKDGVANGPGNRHYSNDLSQYLTDGTKGLDLGTCVANLPQSDLVFFVDNIRPENIGDGIPDIVVTQIADPSGSTDKYEFLNTSQSRVGSQKSISLNHIDPVGNWTADFYEATANPMALTGGFTKTDRPLRLWAADLSYFGITAANSAQVSSFAIHLSGNSDVAFVAYNRATIGIANVLPVQFSAFKTLLNGNMALLNWSTASETGSLKFSIERSTDGIEFSEIGSVTAAGESTVTKNYAFSDHLTEAGSYYYRISELSKNGSRTYSTTNKINFGGSAISIAIVPNPAIDQIRIRYPQEAIEQKLTVRNLAGHLIYSGILPVNSTQLELSISAWPAGNYAILIQNGQQSQSTLLVKQ